MEKERRTLEERRSGVDRRKLNPSNYTGIEKRFDPDGRGNKDRRNEGENWIEYVAPVLKQ